MTPNMDRPFEPQLWNDFGDGRPGSQDLRRRDLVPLMRDSVAAALSKPL
jgi:hypothetical protein